MADNKAKQSAKMEPGMWVMIAVFAVVMVWGIASSYMQIDIADIKDQNGYRITAQDSTDLTLTLPMEKLRKIDLENRVDQPERKIVVAEYDTAVVWLEAVYAVPDYPDLLSLQFDITNNPKKSGTLLLPYRLNPADGTYTSGGLGVDKTAISGELQFADAVSVASTGPREKFGIYLDRAAFEGAGDTLEIVVKNMIVLGYGKDK